MVDGKDRERRVFKSRCFLPSEPPIKGGVRKVTAVRRGSDVEYRWVRITFDTKDGDRGESDGGGIRGRVVGGEGGEFEEIEEFALDILWKSVLDMGR